MTRLALTMHDALALTRPAVLMRRYNTTHLNSFANGARHLHAHVRSISRTSRARRNDTGVITHRQRRGISIAALDADRGGMYS